MDKRNKEWLVINVDGTITRHLGNRRPSYEQIRKIVDMVERIPEFKRYEDRPCVAYCDENGKTKNLLLNELATTAWHEQLAKTGRPFDPVLLVGPVVIDFTRSSKRV